METSWNKNWKKYEQETYNAINANYPNSEIEFDDLIFGLYSKVERQIDFSIRGDLAGKRILGVVDCKFYSKKIDVKIVESFIGMMQDVNANFGFIVTNKGFSKAAKNRVEFSNLNLDILNFNELGEIDISIDYFFNQKIKGLKLSKYEFNKRNRNNTGYFDIDKSDYKKRIIFYKEGFANTEYYAHKKLLENSVRAFRDFSQLMHISLYIPVIINDSKNSFIDEKILFKCSLKRKELEQFLELEIEDLREDISNWRNDFLSKLNKELVLKFKEEFVTAKSYEEYRTIICF